MIRKNPSIRNMMATGTTAMYLCRLLFDGIIGTWASSCFVTRYTSCLLSKRSCLELLLDHALHLLQARQLLVGHLRTERVAILVLRLDFQVLDALRKAAFFFLSFSCLSLEFGDLLLPDVRLDVLSSAFSRCAILSCSRIPRASPTAATVASCELSSLSRAGSLPCRAFDLMSPADPPLR